MLILALYWKDATTVSLLDRTVVTFETTPPFPSYARPKTRPMVQGGLQLETRAEFALLVIALEEDGKKDIQRLYGAVEAPQKLAVFDMMSHTVSPLTVQELDAASPKWAQPTPVHLLVDGHDAAASCTSDDWIASCLWVVAPGPDVATMSFRAHLRSQDGKNDWTALVHAWH